MKIVFSFSWLFFLFKFLSCADTIEAPVYNGYQIVTLVSNTENRFNLEAEAWSSTGLIRSPSITDCDKQWVLGGPDALQLGGYFTTQWNDLPTHDIFYFSMQWMLNGVWGSNDIINLVFDSKTIPVGNIDAMSINFFSRVCDGTSMSTLYLYKIVGKVFHSGPSLTMKIVSSLTTSPNTASFGSRGLNILFANKTAAETESYCFRLLTSASSNIVNRCSCNQGAYDDPSNPGSCISCPTGCTDCFGGSLSQCYGCTSGYSYVSGECIKCHSSCMQCSGSNSDQCVTCSTNRWLYWDGTCRETCTSETTRQIVIDDLWVCELPCPEGEFMLWNETCVDFCEEPLRAVTNSTGVFCDKLCDYDGEFYYINGSCYDSCDLPFVEGGILKVEGVDFDVRTCFWKCETSQYMLWNWTCWDSCDDPLEKATNATGNFCFKPCEDGKFLFVNGSCDLCEFPFKQGETIFDAVSTCEFKCDLTEELLYTNNGSCVSKCEFPFLVRDGKGSEGKFCYSPCHSDEYILADRSCSKNCTLPYYNIEVIDESASVCWEYNDDLIGLIVDIIKGEGKVSYGIMMALSIGKMGSSMSLSLASLAKMLEYVKYMRIDYSQRLELMFQLQGSSELSLSFEVPLSEGIQEKFPDHELPWNFEEYELGSSFFLNDWETFGTLLVVLAGVLVLVLIDMIVRKKKRNIFGYVVMWLKTVFKWNFFLMIFCSNFEGVVFFTSLEVRTLRLDSVAAFVSFIVCVVGNIVAVGVLVRIGWILKDIRRMKYRQVHDISSGGEKKIVDPHRKWRDYQVLFLHCNEEKPIQQAFFVIFLARVYLFHLTIGYLFPHPLAQAIIITGLSVLMLGYLVILRPLEEILDLIKLIITELIVLTVNLCVLVLALLDHNGNQTKASTELFSFIIILANLVFNTLTVIFLAFELISALVKIYKEIRKHKLKGITSLLEIFMMIFAGEAMAMEEEYLSPEEAEAEGEVLERNSVKTLENPKRVKIKTPPVSTRKVRIEILDNISMKNDDVTRSELLKYKSPKSPDSLLDDKEGFSSAIGSNSLVKQSSSGSKASEVSGLSLFFDGSMKGFDKRRERILMRSEKASADLLSLPRVEENKNGGNKKGSPVKSDFGGEDSKLLNEN